MLSKLSKFFLMMSALTPVGITYAFTAYWDDKLDIALWVLVSCTILIAITFWFVKFIQAKLNGYNFQINSIETADSENISFMFLYLLPLFESNFGDLNWPMLLPAIGIFGIVIWSGYGFQFNPLLGLMGWHFYKVGTEEGVTYVLITKKELRNINVNLTVGQLTEFIVIDKGE